MWMKQYIHISPNSYAGRTIFDSNGTCLLAGNCRWDVDFEELQSHVISLRWLKFHTSHAHNSCLIHLQNCSLSSRSSIYNKSILLAVMYNIINGDISIRSRYASGSVYANTAQTKLQCRHTIRNCFFCHEDPSVIDDGPTISITLI